MQDFTVLFEHQIICAKVRLSTLCVDAHVRMGPCDFVWSEMNKRKLHPLSLHEVKLKGKTQATLSSTSVMPAAKAVPNWSFTFVSPSR